MVTAYVLFHCLFANGQLTFCQTDGDPRKQFATAESCLAAAKKYEDYFPTTLRDDRPSGWQCAGRPSMAWQFVR